MNLYFNNAATSWPKPPEVIQAVRGALTENLGNPGRSSGTMGLRMLYRLREALARLFHVPDSGRIIFTCNATHAINLALKGYLSSGDHVVTTSMEHNAVTRPLFALESAGMITCDRVTCAPDGHLDPGRFDAALSRRKPRLAVIIHASNVDGSIQDLDTLGRIAADHGVPMMCDCSQSAGAIPVDMMNHRIAMLAAPGHKGLLGPTGTGFLALAPGIDLEPFIHGGTGSFSERPTQPDTLPDRHESGTLNIHGLAGLRAGVEFILARTPDAIRRHELTLIRLLDTGLRGIDGVTLYGPSRPEDRLAVFSITADGCDPADICNRLEITHGITTRSGLQCAPDAHRTIGTFPVGTVRISPGIFHTEADIQHLLHCLESVIGEIRA